MNFIIFFSVFFILYGLINYYIFIRGLQSFPQSSPLRIYYIILFLIVALSFFIGRTLENFWLNYITLTFVWIGSFWFAAMLYFTLSIIILDLTVLINRIIPFFPRYILDNYAVVKQYLATGIVSLVMIVLAVGHVNARNPRIKVLPIIISGRSCDMDSISIAMMSDIHLGSIVGKDRFDAIVEKINAINADIILLPGDIVDEDLGPVIKQNLGESLRQIRSKYGVFAVTGNHEYIGGVEEAAEYLTAHGVRVLRDEVIKVNNSFYIVGREDRAISQFTDGRRKPLDELLSVISSDYPVILMDHQPHDVDESAQYPIDLQVSGHTHHGQIWPLNLVTDLVYKVSWGYRKDANRHLYVSCGVGTWGPPVRIGNVPEILDIRLSFR